MKKLFFCASLMTMIALSGCFYTPDEEVFKEVPEPNPVGMISLSDYDDGDTIFLYNAAVFDFRVGINQGDIKEISVLMDTTELFKGSGRSGVFSIKDERLKTGLYVLQIEFITSSGTGSLREKMGREHFKLWKQWVVKIDVDPPPTPVLEIVPNADFLTVKWEPYLKENFVSYVINVNAGGRYIVIDDPQVTSWVDSTFLWGHRGFRITVNNVLHSRTSEPKLVSYPQELQFAYRAEDSTALFTWRKSHFPGAFKEVEIIENNESRIMITSPADTTLELKLNVIMGRASSLHFHLRGRHGDIPEFSKSNYLQNPLNLRRLANRTSMYFNLGTNKLIGFDQSLARLDVYDSELNIIGTYGSIPRSFILPSLGTKMFLGFSRDVTQMDLITGAHEVRIGAVKRNGTPATLDDFSAGANGNVALGYIDDTDIFWKDYYKKIYNINSNTLISSSRSTYDLKTGNSYGVPRISDDGRFMSSGNGIQTIEADTVRHIGSVRVGRFAGFRPDNSEEFFSSTASSIMICSSLDLSVSKTIAKPESLLDLLNYDPVTKSILLAKADGSQAYLINVETDEVKALPVYGNNYTFLNGILFHHEGYYIRVF